MTHSFRNHYSMTTVNKQKFCIVVSMFLFKPDFLPSDSSFCPKPKQSMSVSYDFRKKNVKFDRNIER